MTPRALIGRERSALALSRPMSRRHPGAEADVTRRVATKPRSRRISGWISPTTSTHSPTADRMSSWSRSFGCRSAHRGSGSYQVSRQRRLRPAPPPGIPLGAGGAAGRGRQSPAPTTNLDVLHISIFCQSIAADIAFLRSIFLFCSAAPVLAPRAPPISAKQYPRSSKAQLAFEDPAGILTLARELCSSSSQPTRRPPSSRRRRWCCHARARLASDWLAFTGESGEWRVSNSLDHDERFRITSSSLSVRLTAERLPLYSFHEFFT
jgi:hypothetical protein